MINIFLFLSIVFLLTFLIGKVIEKLHIPWIFAALIIGSVLAVNNPFANITNSSTFVFLAHIGMYFLLFIIGFEFDLKEVSKKTKFIVTSTIYIILIEAFLGSLIIHYIFHYSWPISILVALSFATVGEAVLVPILEEFKLIKTTLGQMIIGIGCLDDLIEIVTLTIAVVLIGIKMHTHFNITIILFSLIFLFILTFLLTRLKEEGKKFSYKNIETLFLFSIFILFLFLGIGEYSEATSLAAFLAGVSLKTFIPEKRLKLIENEIKAMCYGLFAPIFFLWVAISINVNYLSSAPLFILLVLVVTNFAKIFGSFIVTKNKLAVKNSILLGIGLSVRFSTSIVLIKILFNAGIIHQELYSVLVSSTIFQVLIIPMLFSWLLGRWIKNT